jgi:tetratricopeptide (TPR) repeat protein
MPASASTLPPQPEEAALSAAQERSLRELALMLSDAAGFKLALATFSGLKQRAHLIKRLAGLLEKRGVALTQVVFTAGQPDASLLRGVREHLNNLQLPAGSRHALSVLGLENLIALRGAAGSQTAEGVGILEEANLHRDTFSKACPFPLLIWLTPADTTTFAQVATDLWHWRSATFDFTEIAVDGVAAIGGAIDLQDAPAITYSKEKLHERQALLEKQLAELTAAPQAETPRALSQRVNLLAELGNILSNLNEYGPARRYFEERLALAERGGDESDITRALNDLAELLRITGRFPEAEPLFRRALTIDENKLGPEHPDVAVRLNNLAQILKDSNDLAAAELLFRRALEVGEKSLGSEHPHVATYLNNLAGLLQDTNRLAEAEPLMRRALAIDEKSYGPEHPKVAIRFNNLAQMLQATNRLAEAEPLMRRALTIEEKSFGPDNPIVAISLNNLAQMLQATHRLAEAEPLSRRAAGIFVRSLGLAHPKTRVTLDNYRGVLSAMKLSEPEIQARLREVTGQ